MPLFKVSFEASVIVEAETDEKAAETAYFLVNEGSIDEISLSDVKEI